ncbi:MAG: hypothetical protein F9K48_08000 [Candidatus Brocadia sp.]|nr:MAG: hypothetical protein F9K48_08000 [Candidatus Brocadia sp.]
MFSKRYHLHSASLDSSAQLQDRTSMRKGHKIRPRRDTKWDDFNRIFDAIADPIMVFDTEFKLIKINKAARYFFSGYPVGKKCFFTKHKFALACKNCPTWQTLKTGVTTTSEILDPKTNIPILLKTYPIYNRLKKIKGVVLIGRESDDVPIKLKR